MERMTFAITVWLSATSLVLGMQCEPQRLPPPPDVPPTNFGQRVTTNGDYWFVGDQSARTWCPGDPFSCSGGVFHVYVPSPDGLTHLESIVPADIQQGMKFGGELAVHGDELMVTASGRVWADTDVRGGAFLYRLIDGQWVETGRLHPPPGSTREEFDFLGGHLAFDGMVAILRPELAVKSRVAVYDRTTEGWAYKETLTAPDGLPDTAFFGENPTLGDGWLFLTAREDSSIADRAGSVYAYRRQPDNTFEFVQKLTAPDPQELGRYGFSADYDDGRLVVGAFLMTREHRGQGIVFVYELEDGRWVLQQELTHSDAGP
ncbi:MAG: hypothetical protein RIB58_12260, partial [Phycisphaerales bacterium]